MKKRKQVANKPNTKAMRPSDSDWDAEFRKYFGTASDGPKTREKRRRRRSSKRMR